MWTHVGQMDTHQAQITGHSAGVEYNTEAILVSFRCSTYYTGTVKEYCYNLGAFLSNDRYL